MSQNNKINLYELYEIKKNQDIKHKNVFNQILDVCYKKIKKIAEHGGMCLYFKVPPVVIGYPLYNYDSCMSYIKEQITKSGLFVMRLENPNNNYIYISWKIDDLSQKHKSKLLLLK